MKKHFKNFYFVLALLLLGIFVLAFIVFYEKNQLFILPFDSSVWGTASDWVMIIVTLGTAYWLIQTFREQRRANDISESVSRREVLPIFSVRKSIRSSSHSLVSGKLEITLSLNRAYYPEARSTDFTAREIKFPKDYVIVDEVLSVWVDSKLLMETKEKTLIMTIYFSDIDDRKYVQIIWWEDYKFSIDLPHLFNGPKESSFFEDFENWVMSKLRRKAKKTEAPF